MANAPATPLASPAGASPPKPPSALLRVGWLIAALIGAAIYLPSLHYAFISDDNLIVLENDRIRHLDQPMAWLGTSWWNREHSDSEYRPIAMASFALNYAFGGTEPAAYRAVNLLLHGLVCALVWVLAMRLFERRGLALAAALLFALHPVHIEAVAGVVGRAELLMTAFFLLAMLACLRSLAASSNAGRWGWAAAALPAAFLSIGSKEHGAMILPAAALLWMIPPAPRDEQNLKAAPPWSAARFRRLVPALIFIGAGLAIYFLMRRAVIGSFLRPPTSPIPLLDNPLAYANGLSHLAGALYVSARYALALIAPYRQLPDYSFNAIPAVVSISDPRWIWGMAALAACVAGLWFLRRRREMWFGLAFALITFFVASNLVLPVGTIMAERLLYLPSVGFCIFAAAIGADLARLRAAWAPWVGWGALALWGAALFAQHSRYLPYWKDAFTLAKYAVERQPESARIQSVYGNTLSSLRQYKEARVHLERAVAICPEMPRTLGMLGMVYNELGDAKKAEVYFERSLAMDRSDLIVVGYYVKMLTAGNQKARAERILREAVRMEPRAWRVRYALGIWLATQDRAEEAISILEEFQDDISGAERPYYLLQLANSYNLVGRHEDSMRVLAELLSFQPANLSAQMLLAVNYATTGELEKARKLLRAILEKDPAHVNARRLLSDIGPSQPNAAGHEMYR